MKKKLILLTGFMAFFNLTIAQVLKVDTTFDDDADTFLSGVIEEETEKVIIPHKFSYITELDDDNTNYFIVVDVDGNRGLYNNKGEIIVPVKFEKVSRIDGYNDHVHVRINDKQGIYNLKGKEIVPPIYESADDFYQSFVKIKDGEKYGVYSLDGRIILEIKYDFVMFDVNGQPFRANIKDTYYSFDRDGNCLDCEQ